MDLGRRLHRHSPFAFACGRCGRCCAGQAIGLNAYEIFRLARRLELSTTAFIAAHADNAGLFLRFAADGRCGFLAADGCQAHPDRPLACRLYPLGLEEDEKGGEVFVPLARPPACAGRETAAGASLAAFLEDQQAAPFLAAAAAYQALAGEVLAALAGLPAGERRARLRPLIGDGRAPGPWLDLDAALGGAAPADPAQALARHLAVLRRWLAGALPAARR
ncbi:MAG: YkgJ family cysteine cluster protein [Thermodesulfobacteriota bacterium]